jgi:small neutral amino acid transporter SnatA (MarC family)
MVERARGKGNLRTKTITMYCGLIATVVLKYMKRVSILILSRLQTLIILKFSEDLYIRGILKGI